MRHNKTKITKVEKENESAKTERKTKKNRLHKM